MNNISGLLDSGFFSSHAPLADTSGLTQTLNGWTADWIGCVIQITLVVICAAIIYALVHRRGSAIRFQIMLTGICVVAGLSLVAFSPWPRWWSLPVANGIAQFDAGATRRSPSTKPVARPLPTDRLQLQETAATDPPLNSETARDPQSSDNIVAAPDNSLLETLAKPLDEATANVSEIDVPPADLSDSSPLPAEQPLIAVIPPESVSPETVEAPTPEIPAAEIPVAKVTPPKIAVDESTSQKALAFQNVSAQAETVVTGATHWLTGIALFLLAGMTVGVLRLLIGFIAVCRLKSRAVPLADAGLHQQLDLLTTQLGDLKRVELFETDELVTAATIGWKRPAILLPADWHHWTIDEQRAVLAHELAHISRHDFLSGCLAQLSLALHFYHPLVHWLVRRFQLEQELVADAAAALLIGNQKKYTATLVELALRQPSRNVRWPAQAFLPTRKTFLRRIEMLRDHQSVQRGLTVVPRTLAIGLLLLAGIAAGGLRNPTTTPAATAPADKQLALNDNEAGVETDSPLPAVAEETADGETTIGGAAPEVTEKETDTNSKTGEEVPRVVIQCVDAEGNPVAGAEVYLFQATKVHRQEYPPYHQHQQFGPYLSDEQGRVVAAPIIYVDQRQQYSERSVYARVPGNLIGVSGFSGRRHRPASDGEIRIEMRPSQTIEGRVSVPDGFDPTQVALRLRSLSVVTKVVRTTVLNADGSTRTIPVETTSGFARDHQFPGIDTALPQIFETHPNAEGQFTFHDIPVHGQATIIAEGEGLGNTYGVNSDKSFDEPIEIRLEKEGILSGRVLTPEGKPAVGVQVYKSAVFGPNAEATTDERGQFRLDGLGTENVKLSVVDPRQRWAFRADEEIRMQPGQHSTISIRMQKGVVVGGRVVDPAGQPVEGVIFFAVSETPKYKFHARYTSDADGHYQLCLLEGGLVEIRVMGVPHGFATPFPKIVKKLEISPLQGDVQDLNFTLQREPGHATETTAQQADTVSKTGETKRTKSNRREPMVVEYIPQSADRLIAFRPKAILNSPLIKPFSQPLEASFVRGFVPGIELAGIDQLTMATMSTDQPGSNYVVICRSEQKRNWIEQCQQATSVDFEKQQLESGQVYYQISGQRPGVDHICQIDDHTLIIGSRHTLMQAVASTPDSSPAFMQTEEWTQGLTRQLLASAKIPAIGASMQQQQQPIVGLPISPKGLFDILQEFNVLQGAEHLTFSLGLKHTETRIGITLTYDNDDQALGSIKMLNTLHKVALNNLTTIYEEYKKADRGQNSPGEEAQLFAMGLLKFIMDNLTVYLNDNRVNAASNELRLTPELLQRLLTLRTNLQKSAAATEPQTPVAGTPAPKPELKGDEPAKPMETTGPAQAETGEAIQRYVMYSPYVPANAAVVVMARPKEMLQSAALKPFAETLQKAFAQQNGAVFALAEIDQLIMTWADPPAGSVQPLAHPVYIVQSYKKRDWIGQLKKIAKNTELRENRLDQNRSYFTVADHPGDLAFCQADEHTLIIGDEVSLLMAALATPDSKPEIMNSPAWGKASEGDLAIGVESSAFRRLFTQLPQGAISSSLQPGLKLLGNSQYLVGSLNLVDKTDITLRLKFKEESQAKSGRDLLNALRIVMLNSFSARQTAIQNAGDTIPAPQREPQLALLSLMVEALEKTTVELEPKGAYDASTVKAAWSIGDAEKLSGLVSALQTSMQQSAAGAQSHNNFKQIGLGLHKFHDVNAAFPPASAQKPGTRARHSWRVALLPYIGQQKLYDEYNFDEPWDSEANKKLLSRMPAVYASGTEGDNNGLTSVLAVAGPDTVITSDQPTGDRGYQGVAFNDITDGTSYTVMIVESKKQIPWTKPEDIPLPPDQSLAFSKWIKSGKAAALLGDGSVRQLMIDEPATDRPPAAETEGSKRQSRALFTRSGGEVVIPPAMY